jgi:hypothetical protein
MGPNFADLFSLTNTVYCLCIWFIVMIFRHSVESIATKLNVYIKVPTKYSKHIIKFWLEVFLPFLPILLGGLGAFFLPTYPFPASFLTSVSARIILGVVLGATSGVVYRMLKSYIGTMLPNTVKTEIQALTGEDFNKDPVIPGPPIVPVIPLTPPTDITTPPEK